MPRVRQKIARASIILAPVNGRKCVTYVRHRNQEQVTVDTSITYAFIPEGESARRWHFHRVLLALFQPRQTFQQLAALDRSLVSTPSFCRAWQQWPPLLSPAP